MNPATYLILHTRSEIRAAKARKRINSCHDDSIKFTRTMSNSRRTVLITGCSDGGLGAALALSFHHAGLHVYATARDPSKMTNVQKAGIETLSLDVLSQTSIDTCVAQIPHLDILVNNAGGGLIMSVSDLDISQAKNLFDLNVWAPVAITQAFLPLLLKSKGIVVNNTSVASTMGMPFQGTYSASKAAFAMFSDALRLEMQPFGVTVVDLKTGAVKSNFFENHKKRIGSSLPEDSIYAPAKAAAEYIMGGDKMSSTGMPSPLWADQVVKDIIKEKPSPKIWRGAQAFLSWLGTWLPFGMMDGEIKKAVGFDAVEKELRKH